MTWLANLYKTYEDNRHAIGQFERRHNDQEYTLIPIAHTTQSAHIEVAIDGDGHFLFAKVIDKKDAITVIPCTEASANRTSTPVPYPLFDKLIYVAGDFTKFGGIIKKGTPHTDYMRQLQAWCESPYAHHKVISVYKYLRKGQLIEDLIREKIIVVDENNRMIKKWNRVMMEKYGETPPIFQVLTDEQTSAFVRFTVNIPGDTEPRLWRDRTVQESYIKFYSEQLSDEDLCYVTGKVLPYADKHSSKIRHSADRSKLISANDTRGFTFRGRFVTSRDAVSISYEVSQKAHNALKWLIAKQGYMLDGKVFLVWGIGRNDLRMPDPLGGTFDLYGETDWTEGDRTHKEYAVQVRRAIAGYRSDLKYATNINIMILDAATPGRMSINYYRDMNKELFLDRLQRWHETCYWLHPYKDSENGKMRMIYGSPPVKEIAYAAFGSKTNDKMIKSLMERMLPTIIDGRKVPQDIIRSVFYRASNPVSMETWEWEKTLSIACALIKKGYEEERFDVTLDPGNRSRDYLFGRLLAVADVLERSALDREEDKRATNAIRYMNAFAQRPARTWTIIQSNLQPYQARLGQRAQYYNRLLDEIGSQIRPDDFTDKPLAGLYLLGFYSQRYELYRSKKDKQTEQSTNSDHFTGIEED